MPIRPCNLQLGRDPGILGSLPVIGQTISPPPSAPGRQLARQYVRVSATTSPPATWQQLVNSSTVNSGKQASQCQPLSQAESEPSTSVSDSMDRQDDTSTASTSGPTDWQVIAVKACAALTLNLKQLCSARELACLHGPSYSLHTWLTSICSESAGQLLLALTARHCRSTTSPHLMLQRLVSVKLAG